MPSARRHLVGRIALVFALVGLAAVLAGPSLGAIYVGRDLGPARSPQQSTQQSAPASQRSALDFIWPADGPVTSPFGPRGRSFHPGVDIGMLRSLAVRAATAGDVTGAGYLTGYEGYGNVVVVDIGFGYTVLYAHLAAVAVRAGESVGRGDAIGTAGCTGSCSGTHLHFELRLNGKAIDPSPYLP